MRRLTGVLAGLFLLASLPAVALAAAPANDFPTGATAVGFPGTIDQDTTEATVTTDDVGCGAGGLDQATVWYTFSVPDDTSVIIDATASDYHVGVNVFAVEPTAGGLVGCSEGGIVFAADAATTYYVMFADIDEVANGGHLLATIDVAPPPVELTLTVDPQAKPGPKGTSLLISGTLTCDQEAEFSAIDLYAAQTVGRFIIHGSGFAEPSCGPVPVAWTAEVPADNGRFGLRTTTVDAHAYACVSFQCADQTISVKVRVKR